MDKIRANLTVEVRIVSSLLLLWERKGKFRGEFVHKYTCEPALVINTSQHGEKPKSQELGCCNKHERC